MYLLGWRVYGSHSVGSSGSYSTPSPFDRVKYGSLIELIVTDYRKPHTHVGANSRLSSCTMSDIYLYQAWTYDPSYECMAYGVRSLR